MKYLSFGSANFHPSIQIICKQQMTDLAVSDCSTLIGLTVLVYPVHVNYSKEETKHTLASLRPNALM